MNLYFKSVFLNIQILNVGKNVTIVHFVLYFLVWKQTACRWQQVTVLMSETLSQSFKQFIQMADSFKKEASAGLYKLNN